MRAPQFKDTKRRAPQGEGGRGRGRRRRRQCLAPPFICFLPPGPALCKLGSARSAFLPEVFTQVLRPFFDLPSFYFHGLFPSLSFSHHKFALLFPILLPNRVKPKNQPTKQTNKQKTLVVNVTGDGSDVRCYKQYCIGTWNVRSMNQGKLDMVKPRWQE